jgi:hypothetical protein
MILNLFYEDLDEDRWVLLDRYPRRVLRRVLRGRPRPGGHKRVFLNLCAGLDRLGVRYRVNDYGYARRNPAALACIIGKPHVLDKWEWKNPILFGAAVFSHPTDDPNLFNRRPVHKVLVPGPWMKEMWKPFWNDSVAVWPVGIDTLHWDSVDSGRKSIDVLVYDKVMWNRDRAEFHMIEPIRRTLLASGRSFKEIRYGDYAEEEFRLALSECRSMIFLCEHETQGIAYQQALSCNVPILAWNPGGYWQDPCYFPHRVQFQPVSSVPYWDERCGRTFASIAEFEEAWQAFWNEVRADRFSPRDYILETLTLEKGATAYLRHVHSLSDGQQNQYASFQS